MIFFDITPLLLVRLVVIVLFWIMNCSRPTQLLLKQNTWKLCFDQGFLTLLHLRLLRLEDFNSVPIIKYYVKTQRGGWSSKLFNTREPLQPTFQYG